MEKEEEEGQIKRNNEDQREWGRILTRRATFPVILLPRPWQLKKGKEAERVPVQVAVRVQLRLLLGWGVAWGEGETQVVAHLYMRERNRKKRNWIGRWNKAIISGIVSQNQFY